MRDNPVPDHAILDAWREQGADRMDPLAFHYLVALRRRAIDRDGDARRELERRLSDLIAAYAGDLARTAAHAADASPIGMPARGMLGELADELAGRAASRNGGKVADDNAARAVLPELGMLDDFRKIWASVRSDSQVRRSLEDAPSNAGPLNSSRLVHRSLSLMRELSPGYLQQFLAYVDALSWLEQMNEGGVLAAQEPPQRDSGKPRTRKPRKRRE
ncbi:MULTISPECIES: DUF2894 domain-containing protein [unclassified Lysobacter]|uniref:DUF2894 domain-containing protein n=1 Tax=unclassified Lysobacter TaxID=2635362 RepID=UPI0006F664CC|nr:MULTISPECIES: DUF2894 domain-containing protein [unclassified Lysobacter]KRA73005.1 hypothetical protein ASD78_15495 [Lysobacter sp. Root667]KRC32035.1 hypothetical protein ASE10_15855 [Lysobacter sp. Root76]KRD67498.1 hypothetical protein ASE45_12030 [Lysobacter sp. Root96]